MPSDTPAPTAPDTVPSLGDLTDAMQRWKAQGVTHACLLYALNWVYPDGDYTPEQRAANQALIAEVRAEQEARAQADGAAPPRL